MNTTVRNALTATTLALGLGLGLGFTTIPAHAQSQTICERPSVAGYSVGTDGWFAELATKALEKNPEFFENAKVPGMLLSTRKFQEGDYFGRFFLEEAPKGVHEKRLSMLVNIKAFGPGLPYGGMTNKNLHIVRTSDGDQIDYVWAKACQP